MSDVTGAWKLLAFEQNLPLGPSLMSRFACSCKNCNFLCACWQFFVQCHIWNRQGQLGMRLCHSHTVWFSTILYLKIIACLDQYWSGFLCFWLLQFNSGKSLGHKKFDVNSSLSEKKTNTGSCDPPVTTSLRTEHGKRTVWQPTTSGANLQLACFVCKLSHKQARFDEIKRMLVKMGLVGLHDHSGLVNFSISLTKAKGQAIFFKIYSSHPVRWPATGDAVIGVCLRGG